MNLKDLGWNEFFEKHLNKLDNKELVPARVARVDRDKYWLYGDFGEMRGDVAGKMRFIATSKSDFPVVGDWVITKMRPVNNSALIEGILERSSKFSRKIAGSKTDEQALVVNVDTIFLVTGLDNDFKRIRVE
jgi:ribosome biogenesis GTPase / thiamine phosphate phosphatase